MGVSLRAMGGGLLRAMGGGLLGIAALLSLERVNAQQAVSAYQFVAGRLAGGAELRTATYTVSEAQAACDLERDCSGFDAQWSHGSVDLNVTLRSGGTAIPATGSLAYFRLAPHERGYDFAPAPGQVLAETAANSRSSSPAAASVQEAMRRCDALAECLGFVPLGTQLQLHTAHDAAQIHGYTKRAPLLIGHERRSLSVPDTFTVLPGVLHKPHVFAELMVGSGIEARDLCARETRCIAYALNHAGRGFEATFASEALIISTPPPVSPAGGMLAYSRARSSIEKT